MTDSMKFGPEWLRNLSQENSGGNANNNSSSSGSSASSTAASSVPRFQLAEHRYGREEMLALFDSSVVAPDSLKQINALYVEKTQTPLLLLQWTEEETRVWNRGNNDTVSRLAGKGGQGPGGSSISGSGNIRGGLGGRGGSMDRGRGRGRGFHYNRGLSYDESDGNSGPPSSYSRSIRSFDRDRMQGGDRANWTERNGDLESSSPRKEFGSSGREMSWRRHSEEESWRTTRHDKWVPRGSGGGGGGGGMGGNSNNSNWRDDWDREPNHRNDNSRTRLWDEPNPNRPWDSEDNLPEWATEKTSESGGSFDASGAFHGTNSDDDEETVNSRVSKQKNREEDVHAPEISSNNRVPSSNHSESNGIERHMNGPLTHSDRLESNSKKSKERFHQEQSEGPPPLRQSHSTSSISNSSPPMRKISAPSQQAHENTHPHPLATSTSLSGMPVSKRIEATPEPEKTTSLLKQPVVEEQVQKQLKQSIPQQPQTTQQQLPPSNSHPVYSVPPSSVLPPVSVPARSPSLTSVKTEDTTEPEGMKHMQEVVAKLVDVDDSSLHAHSKPPHTVSRALDSDQWFYTDPQGEVQGPFSSAEMSEWYRLGYFSLNLMVRRADEQKFSPLGDQMKKYGKILFLADPAPTVPVPALPVMSEATPVPPAARPNPVEEALLYQQVQFQNFVLRQQQQALAAKALSQPEHWNSLSPEQQMLMRASLEQNSFQPMPTLPPSVPAPPQIPVTSDNSVGAALLIQKLQQAQAQAQAQQQQQHQSQHQLPHQLHQHQQQPPPPPQLQEQPQQLVGGDPHLAGTVTRTLPQPLPPKTAENDSRSYDSVVSFLCQVQQNMSLKQVDSVWSGPNPAAAAAAQQISNWGTIPPLWGDVQPKMKTEQEILEEQRAEEARKKEELRKQAELNLKLKELKLKEELAAAEEERKKRKKAEEEEAERKRKEEEDAAERKRKKQEEEAKRKEAAAKKAELERKKEEEKKRKEEEKKRKEEEKRRQEEEKRKLEDEKKKQEEERKRKEEENRRTEQARKQTEALKRLQEQAKVSPPWAPPPPPSTSLSEILKTERKQQQQLREQQLQQQQQLQFETQVRNQSSNKMQLKWAEQKLPTKVKSLAEIQAEEQENLIAKQVEKEKERSLSGITTSGSIWSGQNLTWSNHANPPSVWGNATAATGSSSGPGFWEDVSSPVTKNQTKATNKVTSTVQSTKSNVGKTRTKKEEAVVMKLFEQNKPRSDEFFLWCTKALSAMQSDLDVPTFVTFLRDIESEYEVREYCKLYLGDRQVANDFAAQFLERRTKMTRPTRVDNTSNVPAVTTNHFQEVKGKSKKPKKNKMLRVDNRILGFNVTAAQDRINVGDRDYGDGI